MPRRWKKLTALAAVSALALSGFSLVQAPTPAVAAVASQFNPGMIISDALFFDGNAMSASEVQSFLSSRLSNCSSGYVCLRDYRQDTPGKAAVAGRCGAVPASTNETAASILARVGSACGISQKVLLVLLQKEQSLVTSSAPSSTAYRSATGYGCPDTAPCEAQYYGFFNQVYMAALQFKRYAASPTSWNHVPGRVNNIAYSPNSSCGAGSVLIQNQATAGLYNYTPYQPNGAALANLYGRGDGCSSYGNRNFWTFYTDWFGPTSTSSLVRTADNATVYVISGDVKYPVPNAAILGAYSVLGPLSFVSSSYVDSFRTGPTAGRIIRNSTGGIYFIDAAIKTLFPTCAMVRDYGGSCDSSGYVQLTDSQVNAFVTGPEATQVLATVEGGRYYLKDGVKHEVLDDASQAAAGIPPGFNVLTDAAVANLPLGTPVIRDGVYIRSRGQNDVSFVSAGVRYPLTSGAALAVDATARRAGTLLPATLAAMPTGAPFAGVFLDGTGSIALLSPDGRYTVDASAIWSTLQPIAAPAGFLDGYPSKGTLGLGSFTKSPDNGAIYVIDGEALRPAVSWGTLVAVAQTSSPTWATLTPEAMAMLKMGRTLLTPGQMYRSPGDPQIYLIDGLNVRYRVSTFVITDAIGYRGFDMSPDEVLAQYDNATADLTYGVICDGVKYVAASGSLHPISTADEDAFGIPFGPLDTLTCAQTRRGAAAVPYIRTPAGGIFALEDGVKRSFSWESWVASGATTWMQVDYGLSNLIPSGAPMG